VGGLGHVPGDRLAFAIEVGREVDVVGAAGGLRDGVDLLAAVGGDDVFGGEVAVHVDTELALAGVLGKISDVTERGDDLVVGAEIPLDRPGLGRRLHDDQVLHAARSVASALFAAAYAIRTTPRSRSRTSSGR
jgi:hypothetical protein